MIQSVRPLIVLTCLVSYAIAVTGCGPKTSPVPPPVTPQLELSTQAADGDHDHDHDHDHPEHGPRGGHLVEMSDGSKVEVTFADDLDMFAVYPDNAETVQKVEMITTIDGEEKTYVFGKQSTPDNKTVFPLTDPELGTAAKMGDAVDIKLVVTYDEGTLTGKFEHHQH